MSLRIGAVVLDCRDPRALADFYSQLLDWPVGGSSDRWVLLTAPEGGPGLAFQRAEQATEALWPDPNGPALVHLDVEVADLAAEHRRVVALGARPLTAHPEAGQPDQFRVYADPAGHPFCLCAC